MQLSALYEKLTPAQRVDLAKKAEISEGYLYQMATRWRGKKPSIGVLSRLAAADKRLKLADMVAEFNAPTTEQA
jgi:hypothetical protein